MRTKATMAEDEAQLGQHCCPWLLAFELCFVISFFFGANKVMSVCEWPTKTMTLIALTLILLGKIFKRDSFKQCNSPRIFDFVFSSHRLLKTSREDRR